MSVIVKGMEMPDSCDVCDMVEVTSNLGLLSCKFTGEYVDDCIACRHKDCPMIAELPEKHGRLTDIYVRDKVTNEIRRVGDDQHDMLTITEANELVYHNLQNGDGCRTGDDCGGYEFVPNEDEHGYNADPRKEGDNT